MNNIFKYLLFTIESKVFIFHLFGFVACVVHTLCPLFYQSIVKLLLRDRFESILIELDVTQQQCIKTIFTFIS